MSNLQVLVVILTVFVALALIVLVLLQRGPGATAGSGFGAGASATVFGARGSASFLTRSTAALATAFFVLTLGHAVMVSQVDRQAAPQASDLGVMSGLEWAPPADTGAASPDLPPATEIPPPPAEAVGGDQGEVPAPPPGD